MSSTFHDPTPSSGERTRGSAAGASARGIDLRISLVRSPFLLPWRSGAATDDLPGRDVLRAAHSVAGRPGAFLVEGGDPLRRGDLPALLHELHELRPENLGLTTAGAGLTSAALERLRSAGVRRINVPFHSARRDAHDWLVGQPGALRMALRAIRTGVEGAMAVTAEVVVTRPTMPHLAETIDVLTRAGVRTIVLRRLTAADVEPARFVLLAPRLSLLTDDLERAVTIALQRRARVEIRDFPPCTAPRLQRLFARVDAEVWLMTEDAAGRVAASHGCADCPGAPRCGGAPADYVARFGWEELADPGPVAARVRENVAVQRDAQPSGTMVLSWRGPRRLRCDGCADDPPTVSDGSPAGPESTRAIRARLVDAARFRPATLRLVGAELLAHPNAAALLYDAVRLFPNVECAGEGSAIVKWRDVDMRRLKTLRRIDVALYGPEASSHDAHCGIAGSFAATLRGAERLRAETSIAVGAYAILHDARLIPRFVAAWNGGELPGEPRFRLAADGSHLEDVAEHARRLPAGAARSALLAVLPRCLGADTGLDAGEPSAAALTGHDERPFAVAFGRRVAYAPCGADPIGAFAGCAGGEACVAAGCPGTAIGWLRNTRSQRWMQDS